MVAAENGAIPKMKVGGVADVVHDVPRALAAMGHTVDIIVPAYGYADQLPGSHYIASFDVPFAGQQENIDLFRLTTSQPTKNIQQYVLKNDFFASAGKGKIYNNDPNDPPYAKDATKFALFCAAVAEIISQELIPTPNVLHLHDWHTALIAVLATVNPSYSRLKNIHTVFSIHNLAFQGTRPFRDDESSFEYWFPFLSYDGEIICDPQAPHCLNFMRAGINLADRVHVVSPQYATEILQVSRHAQGFFGGEGLEQDLHNAKHEGRLIGIINGCEYPSQATKQYTLADFYSAAENAILKWMSQNITMRSVDYLALHRLNIWRNEAVTGPLFTSIGRLTDQKVLILRQQYQGRSVLSHLLTA
jgi:starch synthase